MASLGRHIRSSALLSAIAVVTFACTGDDTADSATALTAHRQVVTVNGEPAALNGEETPVLPGDAVAADAEGLGDMEFGELFELSVFKGGHLATPDLSGQARDQEPIAFDLKGGHLSVRVREAQAVTVAYAGARFTTRAPDTEFAICYNPETSSWCLVVAKGEGDWWNPDLDESVPIRAGESTFAADTDAVPEPVRCAPPGEYAVWMDTIRTGVAAPSLPDLVRSWPLGPCGSDSAEDGETTTTTPTTTTTVIVDDAQASDTPAEPAKDEVTLPTGRGMVEVAIEAPVIGSDVFGASPGEYLEPTQLDGPTKYHIDTSPVSNEDLLRWIADQAGNDPEIWTDLAPQQWLDEALAGLATRATYPPGEDELPAEGASWQTSVDYCRGQAKHLVAELEWELAVVNGSILLEPAGTREWVSEWDRYGPGIESGQVVIRGNDNTREPDIYFRNAVTDSTASRRGTRIRCAASEVEQEEPVEFAASYDLVIDEDSFLELGKWPEAEDEAFSLDYHDPDVYHLEARRPHTQGLVARTTPQPLESVGFEAEVFIERSRMGTANGNYRFGIFVGALDDSLLLFTVQPDEAAGTQLWCLSTVPDELAASLRNAGTGYAWRTLDIHPHPTEDCESGLASSAISVPDVDMPIVLQVLVDGAKAAIATEGTELARIEWPAPVDVYGFYSETYNKDVSHIHYDRITLRAR